MAILAGLNTTAISRLKKTWDSVPSKIRTVFDSLNETMSEAKGFKNYRQELAIAEPPCIPFLGTLSSYIQVFILQIWFSLKLEIRTSLLRIQNL